MSEVFAPPLSGNPLAGAPSALVSHDASDLPNLIERARNLFDAGDVIAARQIASGAYDMAKTMARLAISKDLIDKAHRLQGDALLIESLANVKIADEYDAAQGAGVAAKGRPKRQKGLSGESNLTVKEIGLTSKKIHEARRLRDKERREPGIIKRVIAARVEAGFEPTRASVWGIGTRSVWGIGTRSATRQERGDDFYQTPREAIQALLCLERFGSLIFEPSCGHGAISKPLEAAGYEVIISDLVDRGCANQDGELQHVADFLTSEPGPNGPLVQPYDIVTNPPFGIVNEYIHHALTVHRPRKMAMLLNLNALCGADDEKRNFWMETWPPARVLVFSRRLPMMHREGWDGPVSGSQMNCAWFIWQRNDDPDCGPNEVYGTQTLLDRVDWKDWIDQAVLGPEIPQADFDRLDEEAA